MTHFEIYVFLLCLVVFVMFVAIFSYLLAGMLKLYLKSLHAGLEDEAIKTEYRQALKQSKKAKACGCIVSLLICGIFLAFFTFSLVVNIQEDVFFEDVPTLKMVNSGSMAKKLDKNTYLLENGLDDQFQTFDLILVYKAPPADKLALYDVVLYEVDGEYIVHRIIGIEEANENHPEERYFLCRGDANEYSDRFPVYAEQIKAIYKGERIPFVGSFVSFLQSPAGWLCLILVVFSTFGMPLLERKLEKEKKLRLCAVGYIDAEGRLMGGEDEA